MVEDDVQLIHRILSGDAEAFTALVRKHQKGVHALAWRKIGDFHYAEEITQDVFVRVYKYLPKLKDPSQFSGWLYVIANRLCNTWLQENKSLIGSVEDVPVVEIQRTSYERYISEQQERDAREHRQDLVKKLLEKLPESERTVMTLYYLGEMTTKEISKFLGVSVHTITSRLQRARKRLQQDEELLVQEVLGSVPLSASLTESIVQKVADIKLTPPATEKPLLPWVAFGTAVALMTLLLLGLSNQYLNYFQRPYSFEAQSEPTIEIIDAPIVLDIESKPDVRNQIERATTPDKNSRAGTQVSNVTSTSTTMENSTRFSTAQWSQGNAPPSGPVRNLFATSDGVVYAVIKTGIYRLTADATAWTRVDTSVPIGESLMPMAAHRGTLYIVAADEIFASDNRGETWRTLGPRPNGEAVEFVITYAEQISSSLVPITMYLALRDEGIFRSTDGGAHWRPLNDGLTAEKISAMTAVGKTVFAGTENGLYHLDSGIWEKLPLDTSGSVCSLAVSGTDLYAGIGSELLLRLTPTEILQQVPQKDKLKFVKVFHSTDLGASWTEIKLGGEHFRRNIPAGITVLARGKTLLALSSKQYRSTNGGRTWTELERDRNFVGTSRLPAVMVNEKTFYKANAGGIHRTTNGGTSWHIFMNGVVGTRVKDLVSFNNELYAHTGYDVYQSTDAGVSWKKLWHHEREAVLNISTTRSIIAPKLIPVGEVLYSLAGPETGKDNVGIFRLSTDRDMLIPVQDVPIFDRRKIGNEKFYYKSEDREYIRVFRLKTETAAASRDTFYVEYAGELYKWKLGDPEWTGTGLVDNGYRYGGKFGEGFKLAVLGEAVYVGKRRGELFQSLDEGENWRDITPSLPLRFTRFNDMVFVGSTLYVATDNGVMVSHTGEQWYVLTDNAEERPIINRFAVDGSKVYGIGDTGVYHLNAHGKWEQISPAVPGEVLSLTIDRNRLHVLTQQRRMFHISLEEGNYALSHK